ncbi:MAG TPA: S8 family serine peptidase [Saprospiraceae bacterium]|nr:S8 family serine peptidase [Saprospiraceae bacterium]HMQ82298.1 S8 family serine peptidase [Saprospiraceae bacterium]
MIKIGLIDSGVDLTQFNTPHELFCGARFVHSGQEEIRILSGELVDDLGHGTVCSQIIYSICKNCKFYVAKIFDQTLTTNEALLVSAIYWCIEQKVDVINISSGIQSNSISDALREACDFAEQSGIMLVAAAHNKRMICFPAHYHNVIGVGNIALDGFSDFIYTDNSPIDFWASGKVYAELPQFCGHYDESSFSCAKITGMICRLLSKKCVKDAQIIKAELKKMAITPDPLLLISQPVSSAQYANKFAANQLQKIADTYLIRKEKFKGIKKLLVVPLNDNEFEYLHEVQLSTITDVFSISGNFKPHSRSVIPESLLNKEIYGSCDTIALGCLKNYLTSYNEYIVVEALADLMKQGKQFMAFDAASYRLLHSIKERVEGSGRIFFQSIGKDMYKAFQSFEYLPSVATPVVGIIGANNTELASIQLKICTLLRRQGYQVSYISCFPQGDIIQADFSFPIIYKSTIDLTGDQKVKFLRLLTKGIQAFCMPDIIVTGLPGKVVPESIDSDLDWTGAVNFLYGIQPDALILVSDLDDAEELIAENKQVAQAFTKAPIIFQILTHHQQRPLDSARLARKKQAATEPTIEFWSEDLEAFISDRFHYFFSKDT